MSDSKQDSSTAAEEILIDKNSKLTKRSAFDKLKDYFSSMTVVPPTELIHFLSLISFKKIKKNEHFYVAGIQFDKMGFVLKGLLYNYYTKDNGDEVVNYFIPEGHPATCYANLLTETPASYSCRAIEDTYLITVQYSDFKKLYERHRCWDRIGRLGAEKNYIEKEIRERDFLILSGEQRYENFVKTNPHIMDRIPQSMIATFIGIRPESLSRIRANKQS